MTKFLDYVGLQKFKEWADKTYRRYSDTRIETNELSVRYKNNNLSIFEVKGDSVNEDGSVKEQGSLRVFTNLYAYADKATDLPTDLSNGDTKKLNRHSVQQNLASLMKKTKPKIQYIIGKAIPIGKLNGGARLNAYVVNGNIFRFKLSRIPQLCDIITKRHNYPEVDALLNDVTWHLFIDDAEAEIYNIRTNYNGDVLELTIHHYPGVFQLDENKSSVNLSSDMYIYLRTVKSIFSEDLKYTSKTLFYYNGKRIWKPAFENLYIEKSSICNIHSGEVQLQKLRTRQKRSKLSGSRENISVRKYRGQCDDGYIHKYGIYRYRLVKTGKKTQWRTISIMANSNSDYSIK